MLSWHTTDINSMNGRKLSFLIRCWPHNTMWYHVALLLLAGAAAVVSEDAQSSHDGAWAKDLEYKYHVKSHTWTAIDKSFPQFTGITMKGVLNIQVPSTDTLLAKLVKMKYAPLDTQAMNNWRSEALDDALTFQDVPMSGEIFRIKLKHGIIRDISVDKKTPSWEVNMIKSFVSQLQLDTQGENAKKNNFTQMPLDNSPYAMFKAMEDTVGGKCEVHYDISPKMIVESEISSSTWFDKDLPNRHPDDILIEIIKTKNYNKCEQRPTYFAGHIDRVTGRPRPSDDKNRFVTETATSNSIIRGNLKRYTIQSSVTINRIFINPRIIDNQAGSIFGHVNITLKDVRFIDKIMIPSDDLESTGNLVYDCDEIFGSRSRKPQRPNVSTDSTEDQSDSNESQRRDSSSEENVSFESPFEKTRNCPMMSPQFIDMDLSIQRNVNPVQITTDIIDEIVYDLENPNQMPEKETTDKFTMLVSVIRRFSFTQIGEIEHSVQMKSALKKNKNSVYWNIFRDAIVQAGTQSSLKTIKDWIAKRMINDLQTSLIFTRIPRTVYAPTEEYIDELFEIIKMPEVRKQKFMNQTAPLAFAEIVRYSFFDSRKPFGIKVPREEKIREVYIPYMADELKKAVKNGDSPQIQTYIWAIGKFAHPMILSVFEPYLEGKQSISNFQRWWMVCSLDKLAATMPEKVQGVLYKIYANKYEVPEIRSTAVYLMMMTKPSLFMLIRMAAFSNVEPNRNVASAVRSAIQGAANLRRPEWEELARNAQTAKGLLNVKGFDLRNSYIKVIDDIIEKRNFAYTIMTKVIGSDSTFIPKMMHNTMYYTANGYHPPNVEAGYVISDIKRLMEHIKQVPSVKSKVEKIARMLNIQPDEPEQIEGNIFFSNLYGLWFLPFDNHTVDAFIGRIKEMIRHPTMDGEEKVFNKLMSADVMISMPTETGLMFTYNMKSPIIGQMKINNKVQFAERDSATAFKTNSHINMILAQKTQGKFGFVVPFENKQYIAGVDQKVQMNLPIVIDLEANPSELWSLDMRIRAQAKTPITRIFHFSVVPFTATRDVFDIKPMAISTGKTELRTDEPTKFETSFAANTVIVKAESDDPMFNANWVDMSNIHEVLVKPLSTYSPLYKSFDVYFNQPEISNLPWLHLMASYEAKRTTLRNIDINPSLLWKLKPIVSKMDDEWSDRGIKELYESEISKGLDSDIVHIIDLKAAIPSKNVSLLVNMVKNKLNSKMRFLMHTSLLSKILEEPYTKLEVCSAGEAQLSPTIPFDLHRALAEKQEDKLNVEIMYGDKCQSGKQAFVEANLRRSEKMIKKLMKSKLAKSCQYELKKGNLLTPDCMTVNKLVHMRDRMELSFRGFFSKWRDIIRNGIDLIEDILSKIKVIFEDRKNQNNLEDQKGQKDPEKSSFNIDLQWLPALNKAEFTAMTPKTDFDSLFDNSLTKQSSPFDVELDTLISSLSNLLTKPTVLCTVNSKQIVTFDGIIIPVKFGECWHTLLTTYPKENPDKLHRMMPIPEEQQVAILIRDEDNDNRKLRLITSDNDVIVQRSGDNWKIMVDDESISISQDTVYQELSDNATIFKIAETADDNIKIEAIKQEVELLFDGKRVQIKISPKYAGSVRGICGKYDKQSDNEFTVPKNCVVKNPEEFIASYALTDEDCKGPALERKDRAENAECVFLSPRLSNVISDREAGRPSTEDWGYHQYWKGTTKHCNSHRTMYIEEDDKICFSIIPIPSCAESCWATKLKTIKTKVHCMPSNSEEAKQLKSRINRGANPDMRHKTVSKMHNFEIAVTCT